MKSIIITKGNWQYRSENNHEDIEVILPPATVKPVEDGLIWKIKTQLMLHTESELNEHELAENIAFIVSEYPSTPSTVKPVEDGLREEIENMIKIEAHHAEANVWRSPEKAKERLKDILSKHPRPKDSDELEYILAQVDYQIATGSGFELELLQRFKLLVECAVARKNAIGAYWDKKSGKTTYEEMCEKIKEYGKREEQITKDTPARQ